MKDDIYQFVFLDPGNAPVEVENLKSILEERLKEQGLFNRAVFLDTDNYHTEFEKYRPTAAIYFGGSVEDDIHTQIVEELLDKHRLVLPIVDSLKDFPTKVPDALRVINGMSFENDTLEQVAIVMLEELNIIKDTRSVFISYMRKESRAVALQLYSKFRERKSEVFLDTHEIRGGKRFQEHLHARLSNADLVILLNTKSTFSSAWVDEEITLAGELGIGVLNLAWPEFDTSKHDKQLWETELLMNIDFVGSNSSTELEDRKLNSILSACEAIRARALAARRRRMTETIAKTLRFYNESLRLHTPNFATFDLGSRELALFPKLGCPTGRDYRKAAETLANRNLPADDHKVVFNEGGMLEEDASYLRWLNEKVPDVKTATIDEVSAWIDREFRNLGVR